MKLPKKERREVVAVRLPPSVIDELDKITTDHQCTRSAVILSGVQKMISQYHEEKTRQWG